MSFHMRLICLPILIGLSVCGHPAKATQFATPTDALNALVAQGRIAVAEETATAIAKEDARYAWLPGYIKGYGLLSAGDATGAERQARNLLRDQPHNVDIRHLLVTSLFHQKKYKAAIYHAKKNQAAIRDPRVARQYQGILDTYYAVNQPQGVNLALGAAPSSNVNRGASTRQVEVGGIPFLVNDDGVKKSGVNLMATLSAYSIHPLDEGTDLVLKGAAVLSKSLETHNLDEMTFAVSPEVQFQFDSGRFAFGPVLEYQLLGYDPYAVRYGLGATAALPFPENGRTVLQSQLVRQDFSDFDYRNGYRFRISANTDYKLTPSVRLNSIIGFERETTERPHLNYNAYTLGFGITKKWTELGGLNTGAEISHRWQNHEGFYPLLSEPRRDGKLTVALEFSHDKFEIFGVSPSFVYEYVHNASNATLNRYSAHNVRFGINRAF